MIFNAPLFLASSGSSLSNLENGLVGYWALDDSASSSLDDNHGSIVGTGYSWSSGKNNNCFNTGPSGSVYINIASTSSLKPTGSLTITLWLNVVTAHSALGGSAFEKYVIIDSISASVNSPNPRFDIELVNYYAPLYGVADSYGIDAHVYSTGSVPNNVQNISFNLTGSGDYGRPTAAEFINTWRFLTLVRDIQSSSVKTYLNGQLRYTYSISGSIPNNNEPLFIGSRGGLQGVDAKIDEVAMWNRALSPTEILNLYHAGAGRYYPFT